ncbi:MAG: polyphosphate polymerase domain-containing protein [Spirochaetales bacterium]|nr:polyphosphate polymerase domain-containing protein [Spirochaetales bacterium]
MQPAELNVIRNELKFFLSYPEFITLRSVLEKVLRRDSNDSGGGGYWIRSLYFDSVDDDDFHEKLLGVEFRKKVRIRIYDTNDSFVKLELKRKLNQFINKDTIMISSEHALRIIEGDREILLEYPQHAVKYLYALMGVRHYVPAVVIDYTREAFVFEPGTVRITFDKEIKSCFSDFNIFNPDLGVYPVFDEPVVVMEVKYNDFLPSWLKDIFARVKTVFTSVSKYCLGRGLEFY